MKLKVHDFQIYPRAWQFHKGVSKHNATMHINNKVGNLQRCFTTCAPLHINDTYKDSH
jgi:hypothetical protein